MNEIFSPGGKFMRRLLVFVLLLSLPAGVGYPVYGFSSGETTPVGESIVNALPPDGDRPDSYGEMLLSWTNQAGGDTGQTYASPLEATVDTLAHPHLISEKDQIELRPEIDVDSTSLTAWNLGNAPDTYGLYLESANNLEDSYTLCSDASCGDQLNSTGKLRSVISGTEGASREFYLAVNDPIAESDLPDTVTVTAQTGHDTGAWEGSARGRQVHKSVIQIREVRLDELAFDRTIYEGREDVGLLFAEQLDHESDRVAVEVWSEDSTGERVSDPLEFDLIRQEGTQLYERKFGFTEGTSRLDDHPEISGEAPVLKVTGETTVLRARVVEADLSGDTRSLWRPELEGEHVDTLEEVRTWPSPFKPTEGDPFVFQDLPADRGMEIFLYNMQGQLVRRLTVGRGVKYHSRGNNARWWGKNDVGSRVASGTYIYVIKSKHGVKRGKITLVK